VAGLPLAGHSELVELNPPAQYADDRNLSARQRLWRCQVPFFEFTGWVLDLAGLVPGMAVLDAGCGNGVYLRAVRERRATAVGCDLSLGMLRGVYRAPGSALVNADVTALPVRDGAFDVVLAGHLLDLVPDRGRAVRELRRALAAGGTCVAVTTGAQHLRSEAL
jgi:ubiquinone/menaquinone biosynthesis C-methylase UbiE